VSRGSTRDHDEGVTAVPVNADLEIPDKILGPFTARQSAILATAAVVLWLIYAGFHKLVPPMVILAAALIVGGALVTAVTAKKDGLPLDRYLLAALRHHRRGNRYITADVDEPVPAGFDRLEMPAAGLDEAGVLDLGPDGAAVLIECGTVNLALRSGDEVRAALAGFGQALNALGGAFQFTVTAHRIDLAGRAEQVETGAGQLAHPALEARARAHAGLLREISGERDLIARRVLLTLREPGSARHAAAGVLHRAAQAAALLTGCGITARILTAPEAGAALSAATDTSRPAPAAAQAPPGRPVRAAVQAPQTAAWDGPGSGEYGYPTVPTSPDQEG
jgi:hypothetical protein